MHKSYSALFKMSELQREKKSCSFEKGLFRLKAFSIVVEDR